MGTYLSSTHQKKKIVDNPFLTPHRMRYYSHSQSGYTHAYIYIFPEVATFTTERYSLIT